MLSTTSLHIPLPDTINHEQIKTLVFYKASKAANTNEINPLKNFFNGIH